MKFSSQSLNMKICALYFGLYFTGVSGDKILAKWNFSVLNKDWEILTELGWKPNWPESTRFHLFCLCPLINRELVWEILTQLAESLPASRALLSQAPSSTEGYGARGHFQKKSTLS